MAHSDHDAEFTEYIRARSSWLSRIAYLLCGDPHRADDLAQTAAAKLYQNWHRASRVDNLDAYARRVLVNVFLTERQSGWSRFALVVRQPAERAEPFVDVEAGIDLRVALERLPPRQRATVVLRYYCDLTVEQTADALGCSAGTVKSQASRALATLRALMGAPEGIRDIEGIRP